ncbi:MAG: alanine racemase [Candidatus Sedimenticola sp. (ex Thyasira tokunagai)]
MGPRVLIDLSAMKHNLQRARESVPDSKVFVVIKSDAYGHGILRAAKVLADAGADALAVARVDEGIKLREAGFTQDLLVLEGFFNTEELQLASHHQLLLTIHQPEQLRILEQQEVELPLRCWLKADSGMHRLGFQPDELPEAWNTLQQLPTVASVEGVMTHLSSADDRNDQKTEEQLELFLPLAKEIGCATSISNSAGILGWPESHSDWIRPGIMLYGASPFIDGRAEQEGLRPVMTLESRLIAISHYPEGAPIGYGGTYRCPEAMSVGVVAVGYGDGYPRHAPSGTPVLLNSRRVPLVGRVSMDMITVDLRSQPHAEVGDTVVLWGRGLPAEEVAEHVGTISYELFCGVTNRVPRVEFGG